jgi:hypothetical protein
LQHAVLNSFKRNDDVPGAGLDDIPGLGRTDLAHLDLGEPLDAFQHGLLGLGVEGEADAALARTACPARPVNVCIDLLGRLELHDQIDLRDIESSSCHVGGNEALQFSLLEGLEGDFTLFLRDVAMQNLRLLFQVGLEQDLIRFFLGLAEDDGSTVPTTVQVDYISNDRVAVVVRAIECEMFDCFGGAYI